MKLTHSLAFALFMLCSLSAKGQAGPNDFFGGQMPSAPPGVNAAQSASDKAGASGGDYSDDEKRMQKRYKSSIVHAKSLIAKGEAMMKKSESNHDDKIFKKGKIIKEIGEKQLGELQANNPFPNLKENRRSKESQSAGL